MGGMRSKIPRERVKDLKVDQDGYEKPHVAVSFGAKGWPVRMATEEGRTHLRSRKLYVGLAAFIAFGLLLPIQGGAAPTSTSPAPRKVAAKTTKKAAARTGSGVTFSSPFIVDPIHAYGEPDVKVAKKDGATYASGPWGTGTQRSIWNRSTDGGRTFLTLHDIPITSPNQSATSITGPGGGDTEISINRKGTVYYTDLAALASFKTAAWHNEKCNNETGCPSGAMKTGIIANPPQNINGFDRQWFGLWQPKTPPANYTGKLPVNYLLYAQALAGSGEVATYSYNGVDYTDQTAQFDMSNDGPVEVDQKTGTVFEAISVNNTNDVGIAKLTRDPSNPDDPALTNVERIKIAKLPNGTETRALFPVIGFDKNRTLYVAWVTRGSKTVSEDPKSWQIYYSYAKASTGWENWSTPRKISKPPSNQAVMPWAVAGAKGRLAVVWYGTTDKTHDPSTEGAHQPWHVYMANITHADTATPTVKQMKVTRHPMHYGTVCLEGLGCAAVTGNRNLADFFEVSVDPRNGAIVIAYDDTSNDTTQTVAEGEHVQDSAADHKGAPLVTVVRQNGGIGLFGTRIHGYRRRGRTMRDRGRDAHWDPIYWSDRVSDLDLRKLRVRKIVTRKKGKTVKKAVFTLKVKNLTDTQGTLATTGSLALDYVVRWSNKTPKGTPKDKKRWPIQYVAAELDATGSPSFFSGEAFTYELCSVSGCFPHGFLYPKPPLGGRTIKGRLKVTKGPKPDKLIFTVPFRKFGNKRHLRMDSLSAYAFASPRSAAQPPSNGEVQNDRNPVEVDGVCCRDARL